MSKHTKKEYNSMAISERKILWVNRFHDVNYIHIKDKTKEKILTFTVQELKSVFKNKEKIAAMLNQLEKKHKNKKREWEDDDDEEASPPKKKMKKWDDEVDEESDQSEW